MGADVVTQIIAQALAAAGLVLAGWVSARGNLAARKADANASPYEKLAERVVKLETQVGELRSKVERLEDERNALRDRVVDLEAERDGLRAERDELRAGRDALLEVVRAQSEFIDRHVHADIPRPFAQNNHSLLT